LYHLDYFKQLLLNAAPPGEKFREAVKKWFNDVTVIVARNMTELENRGRLNELARAFSS
jgi:hypothetical protein